MRLGRLRWWSAGAVGGALLLALFLSSALARPSAQISLQGEIQRVEERTAQLRELGPTGPITRSSLPRSELRAYLEAKVWENNSPEEIEANEVRWEVLGYVEPGLDLIGIFLDVLGEQVLGFYDPDARSLYLVASQEADASLRPADILTLAHEITHALQDQHYDIRAGQEARRTDNDRQLAYQALVEGDASLLAALYGQRYLSQSELARAVSASSGASAALDAAPLIIQRELIFPYIDGTSFLLAQYRRGGWAAVGGVWADPPSSTEQVLHPEKYLAAEAPVAVTLPIFTDVLGPDWRLLEDNTLGELDWRVLFEQYTDAHTGIRVGTGWGGDRFQLFRRDRDGAALLAGQTAWDSETDASEFFDAYAVMARSRFGAGLQTAGPTLIGGMLTWTGQSGTWHHELTRSQDRVSFVISTDPAAARAVSMVLQP